MTDTKRDRHGSDHRLGMTVDIPTICNKKKKNKKNHIKQPKPRAKCSLIIKEK